MDNPWDRAVDGHMALMEDFLPTGTGRGALIRIRCGLAQMAKLLTTINCRDGFVGANINDIARNRTFVPLLNPRKASGG